MPQPVARNIVLSEKQQHLLSQITRAHTNSYRLVQRAQLILYAASSMTNTEIFVVVTTNTQSCQAMAKTDGKMHLYY